MKTKSDALYDEKNKLRYISTLADNSAKSNIVNLLRRFGRELEEPRGRNLYEFNSEELRDALSHMGYASVRTLRTELSVLGGYLSWAEKAGLTKGRPAPKVHPYEVDMDEGVRQGMVKDHVDLLQRLSQVYPADQGYAVFPVLCLFWLGFESMDEILQLRSNQVDLRRGVIYNVDGGVRVYRMQEEIRACLEAYRSAGQGSRVKGRQQCAMAVYADDLGYLIHRMLPAQSPWKGTPPTAAQLHNQISHFLRKYQEVNGRPCTLTPKSILQSGKCFRIREWEAAGEELTDAYLREQFHLEGYSLTYVQDARRLYEIYRRVFWPGEEPRPEPKRESMPAWLL